jgi:hypothetical protein
VLTVVGAFVGARFLAVRLGLQKVERDLVFVLTDKDLVRKRSGWPDIGIGLSEINALYEEPGWLVVESVEPRRRIAVPEEVDGFASLRAELAKHSPLLVPPRLSVAGFSRFIPVAASILCWGLVMWSKDAGVAKAAGTIALMLLGWESFRLYWQLRRGLTRPILWILVALGWSAAVAIVYLRIARGS